MQISRKRKIRWIKNLQELSDQLIAKGVELELANNALTDLNEEIFQQREEIKAQAEHLQESLVKQRELSEFKEGLTAMIVHDLKNPLNFVLNKAENKEVQESGRQMLNMINNILDVQKYERTKMPVKKNQFVLSGFAVNAISKVEYLSQQKNISIINQLNQCIVFADQELIERVFINLLSNAIKYTPNNGKIEVYAERMDENEMKVYVKDTGPGIPETLKERVFDKFMQIIAKKSGETRSYGLGLTFCKLAIEAHDKVIGVDTAIGKGTSFWFTLDCFNNTGVKTVKEKIKMEAVDNKFSQAALDKILPFVNTLKQYDVYETSAIQKIIDEIARLKISEIDNWLKAVENAVYSVNQSEYRQLIEQFT